tara:strand:- start:1 stop:648 length:648 start_codon:yes stop_codon:yes gene_type:complete
MNKQVEFNLTKKLSASEDGTNISALLTTFGNIDKTGDIITRESVEAYVEKFQAGGVMLRMLFQHMRENIIGQWTELTITDEGLLAKGEIFDTNLGNDTRVLLRRGVLDSVSIGFRSDDYDYDAKGIRTFNSIELVEASIVDIPANSEAVILSVKQEDGSLNFKALKDNLRNSGLSNSQSESVVHSVKTQWLQPQSNSEDNSQLNLSGLLAHINSL